MQIEDATERWEIENNITEETFEKLSTGNVSPVANPKLMFIPSGSVEATDVSSIPFRSAV